MARYDSVLNGVSSAWQRFFAGTPLAPPESPAVNSPYPFLTAAARGVFGNVPSLLGRDRSNSPTGSLGFGEPFKPRFSDLRPYSYSPYYGPLMRGEQTGQDRYGSSSQPAGMRVNGDPSKARGLDGAKRWDGMIKQVANETGVPWQLITAIMGVESGGDPNARSGAGAMGLMQVMPFHFTAGENPFDPYTNIKKGASILKANYDRWGSWDKAVNGYFTGQPDPTGASDGGIDDYGYLNLVHNNLAALGYGQQAQAGDGNGWRITGGVRYQMTQGFGAAETDPQSARWYRNGAHPGLDFGTPMGTPLFAPTGGTVVWAGDRGDGYGNSVIIWNGSHYVLLGHLSAINVQQGQQLNPYAYIGKSGGVGPGAGTSSGPHLHFEVRDANGNIVDPRIYYNFS